MSDSSRVSRVKRSTSYGSGLDSLSASRGSDASGKRFLALVDRMRTERTDGGGGAPKTASDVARERARNNWLRPWRVPQAATTADGDEAQIEGLLFALDSNFEASLESLAAIKARIEHLQSGLEQDISALVRQYC